MLLGLGKLTALVKRAPAILRADIAAATAITTTQ
jgi:hypothetical protein